LTQCRRVHGIDGRIDRFGDRAHECDKPKCDPAQPEPRPPSIAAPTAPPTHH
jgi:hypothetical protein